MLTLRLVVLVLLALGTPRVFAQNPARVLSLNALHYGWNASIAKAPTILAYYQSAIVPPLPNAPPDIIIMQEVMNGANGVPITPGGFTWQVSNLLGLGTYREMYAFITRNTLGFSAPLTYPGPNFARPPTGIMIAGANPTWIIDYHAVFGKSITVRRAEVGNIPAAINWFGTVAHPVVTNRILVGGDWNLPLNDQGFWWLAPPGTGGPNVPTSLTRAGQPSSAYDHFVWNSAILTVNNTSLLDPSNGGPPWTFWRTNVSDHMAIGCDFNR